MNSLIIGASAGLGRALASTLAQRKHDLYLVASDTRDLEAIASDLTHRHGVHVHTSAFDLRDFEARELRQEVLAKMAGVDHLFLVAGAYRSEWSKGAKELATEDLIRINYMAPLKIVESFLEDFADAQKGNIVGIGSVAALRARKTNPVYASCKRGLEFYLQGIRHRLAHTACRVQCYRVGYLSTQMTFGKPLPLPALSPAKAADCLADGLDRDFGVKYLPAWWRLIGFAYCALPWSLYRRLNV